MDKCKVCQSNLIIVKHGKISNVRQLSPCNYIYHIRTPEDDAYHVVYGDNGDKEYYFTAKCQFYSEENREHGYKHTLLDSEDHFNSILGEIHK